MEVARQGGTDKVFFAVLVVVVSQMPRQFASNVDIDVRERLIVVVGERTQRLQDVELRSGAANAGHAVAEMRGDARGRA